MAQIELYFVGTDEHDALERGPITALDTAQMIADGQNAYRQQEDMKVFHTKAPIKSWQLESWNT